MKECIYNNISLLFEGITPYHQIDWIIYQFIDSLTWDAFHLIGFHQHFRLNVFIEEKFIKGSEKNQL